jgi:hypothetical protein
MEFPRMGCVPAEFFQPVKYGAGYADQGYIKLAVFNDKGNLPHQEAVSVITGFLFPGLSLAGQPKINSSFWNTGRCRLHNG